MAVGNDELPCVALVEHYDGVGAVGVEEGGKVHATPVALNGGVDAVCIPLGNLRHVGNSVVVAASVEVFVSTVGEIYKTIAGGTTSIGAVGATVFVQKEVPGAAGSI